MMHNLKFFFFGDIRKVAIIIANNRGKTRERWIKKRNVASQSQTRAGLAKKGQ